MPKNTALVCAAGALALAIGVVLSAAPSRDAFGAGVLRRDGVIVPFAAFDGKRWTSAWPAPALDLDIPVNLAGIPSRWWGPTGALEIWQAWIAGKTQTLRVVQPDWVDVHCVRQIGLRTDYRASGSVPPRTEQPYPKDGLALSPPQPVTAIAVVAVNAPETRALIPVVHEAFNQAERLTEQHYGHPVSRRAREGRAPDIEAIYAAGDNPRTYYVEAIRPYRRLGESECAAIGFATGWFTRDGAGVRSLLTVVDVLRCDRRGASYMLPLGDLRIAGRRYWLAQFSGWQHERFVVVEITPKTAAAVLSVWGGSC